VGLGQRGVSRPGSRGLHPATRHSARGRPFPSIARSPSRKDWRQAHGFAASPPTCSRASAPARPWVRR
jgi:hypothetical protein